MLINCSNCNKPIETNNNICYCSHCKTKHKITIQVLKTYKCQRCNKQYESTEPDLENIIHCCQKCLCEDFF